MEQIEYDVISLFNGMGCAWLALDKAGIKVRTKISSEIDKHAIKVNDANYPETIQVGDITKISIEDGYLYYPGGCIDLSENVIIVGGSPCQGFSFAGKGLNFEDPRSKLFFEFVRLIKECNPKYFLLENVKMKKEHELVITKYLGVEPIEINSALVSAQNRKRLYWTNINQKPYGLFGDLILDIPQPIDKGILLKDVLESNVPDKYYLSDKILNGFLKHNEIHKERGNGFEFKPRNENNKSSCITARYHKMGVDDTFIIASRGRNTETEQNTEQHLEPRFDGKTNCLTSVQKDNLVVFAADYRSDEGIRIRENGKAPTLTSGGKNSGTQLNSLVISIMGDKSNTLTQDAYLATGKRNRNEDGKAILTSMCDRRIRRLTPLECERLQTVPDNYTNHVSDTQRYRQLGNGWTIDVIAHIFSYINQEAA